MLSLQHYHCSLWLHIFHQGVRDLRGKLFLELKPSGEHFDCPGKLAQAHDFPVRDISDMRFPVEGEDVVLAPWSRR